MPSSTLKHCCDFGALAVAFGAIYSYIPAILGIIASLTIIAVNVTQLWDWYQKRKALRNPDI